jgi:hypothetical protein
MSWSRSRQKQILAEASSQKYFCYGLGPKKNILALVLFRKNFGAGPSEKNFGPGPGPGPGKKNNFRPGPGPGPGPGQKKNLVPGPGPLCSSLN